MLNSQVDEIKSRLSVEEVLSGYLQTQRAGRNLKANCPFHNEKTPSFMISPERQIWHCFGCGEGGDIFTFVMKMEGLEFPEALKLLGEKAGVEIKKSKYENTGKKTKIFEIIDLSRKFYQECLKIKKGKIAHEYLIKRGLTNDIIEKFQIGYAPDSWDILSSFLKKKGYKEEDIFSSGMTVKKDKGGYYDRFRGRIMFPIENISGQTIGFSSRVMPGADENSAKYINNPETIIYNKGRVLYGLDKAKISIRKNDLCVMVEGNMDVIASFQAGVENVVATSGTALTSDQIKIIKRYTDNIAFSFDMDSAGIRAAQRGIEIALSEGMNVGVITIAEGKDPADCVKSNPELWVDSVKNQKPIMDFYFETAFSKYDKDSVEGKKKIAEELLEIIVKMSNDIDRGVYRNMLSNKLGVDEKFIFEYENKIKRKKSGFNNQIAQSDFQKAEVVNRTDQLQERILGLIILYPHFFGELFLDLENCFSNDRINQIYTLIRNLYLKENKLNDEILSNLKSEISINRDVDSQHKSLSYIWDTATLAIESEIDEIGNVHKEAKICISNLRKIILKEKLIQLESDIKKRGNNASQDDIENHARYIKEINDLDSE
ncbi:MAG: DNA primase [Patescibacteria group bacterium]|nr:DNA primase [Patescibacteria group bacterium]